MRVLLLVQNFPPERGPVRYSADLACALAEHGHQVAVITGLPHYPTGRADPAYGAWRTHTTEYGNLRTRRIPLVMASNQAPLRRLVGFLSFLVTSFLVGLTEPKPDVVIASVPPLTVALSGLLLAKIWRRPVVFMLRDVEPYATLQIRGHSHKRWARGLIRVFMRLYSQANHIVTVHPSQVQALVEAGIPEERISVIPHGIDFVRFDQLAEQPVQHSIRRDESRLLALYMGSIGAAQGLATLVTDLANAETRALPVDFVFIGGGEDAKSVGALAKSYSLGSVRVLPPVPLDQVASLLSAADLLVVAYKPSEFEIAGMIGSKFYEYCASGRPILVYGNGAAASLVSEIGNGWTCSADDAAGLNALLHECVRLRQDEVLWREIGARGRRHAENVFDNRLRHQLWLETLEFLSPKMASNYGD